MPIKFSVHAKNQLKRRRIPQKLVVDTIRNPENKSSSFNNRILRRKSVGGKILEVVTKTEGQKITVITGYYIIE